MPSARLSRYQTLICSLAYSATGSLTGSEDLSLETFLAAWKHLSALRDPRKLRSWLCGIARNLNHRARRVQRREPVDGAEEMDAAPEAQAVEPIPRDQTISLEEEAILWRSLERIPDNYREPLILFYREHQSVERVADELELSEDVVRQRLSRGRKLLQEEVAAFVEGALRQSAPGNHFSVSVLAALPLNLGAAASAGVAKGGSLLSVLSVPVAGLLASAIGTLGIIRNARTADERRFKKRVMVAMWADGAGLVLALVLARLMRVHWEWRDDVFTSVLVGCYLAWAAIMAPLMIVSGKGSIDFFLRTPREGGPFSGGSRRLSLLGTACAMTAGAIGSLLHYAWRAGDRISVGILAATGAGMVAWTFCGLYSPRLFAGIVRVSPRLLAWVPTAWIGTAALLVLNWRLDQWIAAIRGTDLEDARHFLPMWTVHLSTLLLLAWIGGLALIVRPRPRDLRSGPRPRETV
jgi:RNA polymerase sigma factor (sigma-70 family)